MKDYYSLLGIERGATKAEIKRNYRLLATKYHPDKNTDPKAAEKFIAITEAYEVLNNKKSRTNYDLFVWEQLKRKNAYEDDYNIVVPPTETTRTRRNKAQKNRASTYHKVSNPTKKTWKLVSESLHIVGRYIFHILGLSLFGVILTSVIGHLAESFEKGLVPGLVICLLIAAIIFFLVWILKYTLLEIKLDLEAFSVFYKTSFQTVATISALSFSAVILLYIVFLKVSF